MQLKPGLSFSLYQLDNPAATAVAGPLTAAGQLQMIKKYEINSFSSSL
jgi:hypothetical protein